MSAKDIATIVGLIVLNVAIVWVLFLGGAAWLENSPLANAWPWRRFGFGSTPELSAAAFKVIAGTILFIELAVAAIAGIASLTG